MLSSASWRIYSPPNMGRCPLSERRANRCLNSPEVGDVWESRGGKLRVRVDKIIQDNVPVVLWTGVNQRAGGSCSVANFPRGRRLIERNGQAVLS